MTKKYDTTIEIGHKCPQNCEFCSSNEMNIDEGLSIEDVSIFLHNYEPKSIRWSGGEPTRYIKLMWWVDKVRSHYPDTEQIINTSGIFTYSHWKDTFEKIDSVRFSVLGDKLSHNYMTDGRNFGTMMNNLIKCNSNEGIDVQLTTPYLGRDHLSEVIDIAKSFRLKIRIASLVHPDKFISPNIPNRNVRDFWNYYDELDDRDKNIIFTSCSIDPNVKCRKDEKAIIYPDGTVGNCAIEKIGYCPKKFENKYNNEED